MLIDVLNICDRILQGSQSGISDVEMESIPPPGLYSGRRKTKSSLADRLQYLSPPHSRSSTPALTGATIPFSLPHNIAAPSNTTLSQPLASGSLPTGGRPFSNPLTTAIPNVLCAGTTDTEMESIPPPGLYSEMHRNRPSFTDQPQYLSPVHSTSTIPAVTPAIPSSSSLDIGAHHSPTSSHLAVSGPFPGIRLSAPASTIPASGPSMLNVPPVSHMQALTLISEMLST